MKNTLLFKRKSVHQTGGTPDFGQRKHLTFEQAEGAVSLPSQLQLKEVSQELRAVLWHVVYKHLSESTEHPSMGGYPYIVDPWKDILRTLHIYRDHRMADDFSIRAEDQIEAIRKIFEKGDYLTIFGWLQAVLRYKPPYRFPQQIDSALRRARAAHRVLDKDTIVPVGSSAELETLQRAFADLAV